jgi:hypothetical protein
MPPALSCQQLQSAEPGKNAPVQADKRAIEGQECSLQLGAGTVWKAEIV